MPSIEEIVSGAVSNNDELEIDFSGAVEFEALDGEFPARVLACTPDTSKSGNPMLVWEFALTQKPHEGWKRKAYTVTSGKGSGKAKQIIKAVGGNVEGERIRFRPSSAVGKDVILVLGPQKDSTEYDEIKRVRPASS